MRALLDDIEKAPCRHSNSGLGHSHDHHVDIVVDSISADAAFKLAGVEAISQISGTTFRILYDPHAVGVRDILEHGFQGQAVLAPEDSRSSFAAQRAALRRLSFKTLFSTLLTIPVLILAWLPDSSNIVLRGSISLFFASILHILIAITFYPSAYRAVFHNHAADVDVLITLSTTTAYIFSVIAFAFQVIGKPLESGMFFQTSALLTTIVLIGRLVGDYSRQKAVEKVSIRSLQPETAILRADDNIDRVIDARLLQYGDTINVPADTQIPTDGIVINGVSEVDESMITGEANLIPKKAGTKVVAGALNHQGVLLVRLTRLPSENTISQIARMTDEALASKPKCREIADRVAAWFVPVMLLLSIATFLIWLAVGRNHSNQSWSHTVVSALTYAIAVLIVSCPCAIGLAVPMVLVTASGIAAKHGIIIKSGRVIEATRNIDHVVFDKTGTLTEGRPGVFRFEYRHESPGLVQRLLLGLLSSGHHPVSKAIVEHLSHEDVEPETVENVTVSAGNGVSGKWHEHTLRGGNAHWLGLEDNISVQKAFTEGRTVFCLMLNKALIALIELRDEIRKDAFMAITRLKQRGIEISLLSGDNLGAATCVATALGIPLSTVRARATPADKQNYISSLIANPAAPSGSLRTRGVLFCGDGTNDSIALAQATVGVYMSGGTDIAKGAADVVLASPRLGCLLLLIDISRAAFRRIFFNFMWAFLYNVFAVLLAAGVFERVSTGFRLQPQYAAVGELVSIVPVVLAALQLRLKGWEV